MSGNEDVFELSEHAARAKLSRIIRNSEAGWLFYSPGGTAYHLLTDEAETLERRGIRRILKFNWLAKEVARLPGLAFKLAFAALILSMGLAITFGKAFVSPYGDFVSTYIFPSLILFSISFAVLRPFIMLAIRATYMMLWQAYEARKLRRAGRGAVPAAVEKKHLRYNLFRIIFAGALAVLVVRFVTMWFMTPSQVTERGFAVDIICIGVMMLACVPAGLIDSTHIRRKWLD